jgi:glycerol-3-phosphate dehydrogenase
VLNYFVLFLNRIKAKTLQSVMDRSASIQKIESQPGGWDIIIIGGGATGLGIAMDAASRGFQTLLLEQADFAKATSSRSTKLIHGGVRYLAQGNIRLVLEALHERGLLIRNAPHIVHDLRFMIPCYQRGQQFYYTTGLKLYDLLSGKLSLGKSCAISKKNLLQHLPNLLRDKLKGGVVYHDGQFDDARLAINIAQTATGHGAVLLNYCKVTGLIKQDSKVTGVTAVDAETNQIYSLFAKTVINSTGVFVDEILKMDDPHQKEMVIPSQGVHLVLDSSFLNSDDAIMIPKTKDGRVLFVVPWHKKALVGTTDTPLKSHSLEPFALEEEIEFILQTASRYLAKKPARKDVLSVFAGLRPLAAPQHNKKATKEISRGHKITVADSGLITIIGGKWTIFRKMAEDTVNEAIRIAGLPKVKCHTQTLHIHGYKLEEKNESDPLQVYGSDETTIKKLIEEKPSLADLIHPSSFFIKAQVIWAVREEMARTAEDVLARRLRILFLDAQLAIAMAPEVAAIMAKEMGRDREWEMEQVKTFTRLAVKYSLAADISKLLNEQVKN